MYIKVGYKGEFITRTCLRGFSRIDKFDSHVFKSSRKAMNRNWSNQKTNPALKPKREINKYYKKTKYNENKLLTVRAAISPKVATQQPKLNLKYNEQT